MQSPGSSPTVVNVDNLSPSRHHSPTESDSAATDNNDSVGMSQDQRAEQNHGGSGNGKLFDTLAHYLPATLWRPQPVLPQHFRVTDALEVPELYLLIHLCFSSERIEWWYQVHARGTYPAVT